MKHAGKTPCSFSPIFTVCVRAQNNGGSSVEKIKLMKMLKQKFLPKIHAHSTGTAFVFVILQLNNSVLEDHFLVASSQILNQPDLLYKSNT